MKTIPLGILAIVTFSGIIWLLKWKPQPRQPRTTASEAAVSAHLPPLTCGASDLACRITNTSDRIVPGGEASLMSGHEFFKADLPGLAAGESIDIPFLQFSSNGGIRFQPSTRTASHLLIRIPGYDAMTFGLP